MLGEHRILCHLRAPNKHLVGVGGWQCLTRICRAQRTRDNIISSFALDVHGGAGYNIVALTILGLLPVRPLSVTSSLPEA